MRRSAAASRAPHLHWDAQALWTQLEPLLPGLAVEVVARSASTNTDLLERARLAPSGGSAARIGRRQADTQPCLLVAEHQLAGRGRLGRGWHSALGASLTFSLALALAPRDWSGLSLAVGVALAEALQPAAGSGPPLRLGLKWPNDLWLAAAAPMPGSLATSGRKLGGVLIETLAAGEQRLAVIGVGLNIAPLREPLPSELPERLACVREFDAHASAPATLARVALPLVQALKIFERDGFAAGFGARFAALDLLHGEAVVTTDARVPHGVAHGVDGQGGLRIADASGAIQTIHSGEVSVRPAGRALPATTP